MTGIGPRALLDTSAILDLKALPDDQLPESITVSMISVAELQRGLYVGSPAQRVARRAHYQAIRTLIDIVPLTEEATYYFGQLCGVEVSNGRTPKARTLNLLIAATAIAEGVPLVTCNPRDFAAAEGFVAVHEIRRQPA